MYQEVTVEGSGLVLRGLKVRYFHGGRQHLSSSCINGLWMLHQPACQAHLFPHLQHILTTNSSSMDLFSGPLRVTFGHLLPVTFKSGVTKLAYVFFFFFLPWPGTKQLGDWGPLIYLSNKKVTLKSIKIALFSIWIIHYFKNTLHCKQTTFVFFLIWQHILWSPCVSLNTMKIYSICCEKIFCLLLDCLSLM